MKYFFITYQLYNNKNDVTISNCYTFLFQDSAPTEIEQLIQIKKFVIPDTFGIRLIRCQEITLVDYNKLIQ
jgi:hypothetical protein